MQQQQQASLPVLTSAKLFKCIQFSRKPEPSCRHIQPLQLLQAA